MKVLVLILVMVNSTYASKYEKQISKGLIEDQRKFSGKIIAEMLKKFELSDDCEVSEIKSFDDANFSIGTKKGEPFGYSNTIWEEDDMREISSYDCLLTPDKKRLECERELPGQATYQMYIDNIYTTMYLDNEGQITRVTSKQIRNYWEGADFWPLTRTLQEFDCRVDPDIEHPPKVNDQDRKAKEDLNNEETSDEKSKSIKQ